MVRCPACGEENPERFRLCGYCGAELSTTPTRETRKTVTVLFFDFTQLKSGYVMATLSNVSTPAEGATWGGIKALYRR